MSMGHLGFSDSLVICGSRRRVFVSGDVNVCCGARRKGSLWLVYGYNSGMPASGTNPKFCMNSG